MTTRPTIAVGDTFHILNKAIGGYRSLFMKVDVIGETSRSWVVGPGWDPTKIPKNDPWGETRTDKYAALHKRLFTDKDVENYLWCKENRDGILRAFRYAASFEHTGGLELLKAVAEMIDYKPTALSK